MLSPQTKKLLLYGWVAVAIAIIYVILVFAQRRINDAVSAPPVKTDYGVNTDPSLRIREFYAAPAAVKPGGEVQLCYGVENAKSVTLIPALDEPLKPLFNKCVIAKPTETTTYTLTAQGTDGTFKQASVTVNVAP